MPKWLDRWELRVNSGVRQLIRALETVAAHKSVESPLRNNLKSLWIGLVQASNSAITQVQTDQAISRPNSIPSRKILFNRLFLNLKHRRWALPYFKVLRRPRLPQMLFRALSPTSLTALNSSVQLISLFKRVELPRHASLRKVASAGKIQLDSFRFLLKTDQKYSYSELHKTWSSATTTRSSWASSKARQARM